MRINSFTTNTDINLKDLIAEKIGFSEKFSYLGETEDGKGIYQSYGTTNFVGEDIITSHGEPEDIKRAHKNLEIMLGIKLVSFIKSKKYQRA